MAFGPDIHVFPGGRVDPADATSAMLQAAGVDPATAADRLGLGLAPDGGLTPDEALAHHVAAVRETLEETGVRVVATDLVSLSRWVTPPSMQRRFDVRFFAAIVPPDTLVTRASSEVVATAWMTPAHALDRAASGEITLWQPTFVTLQQLDGLRDLDAVRAAFAPGDAPGPPELERIARNRVRADACWAAGIPGRRATGWLVGERSLAVVDPADPTGVTSDAIVAWATADGARLAGVVVTDLAPERHAGVEMLAHGLGLPVAGPAALAARAPYPMTGLAVDEPVPFGDAAFTLATARVG